MQKLKTLKYIGALLFIILPMTLFAQSVDVSFNPNKLIDDKVFSDTQTFGGAAGIQKFLTDKKSVLANTDPSFLQQLKEPQTALLKQGLDDPEPNLPRLRSAAELIWDASQSTGLNPQVILVTLEKEQSLVDGDFSSRDLQTALDHAMGFACPDSGGCDNLFPGFYYQLFGNFDSSGNRYLGAAKSLMKSFSVTGGRGPVVDGQVSKVGTQITLDNTMGGYDNIQAQQTVTLSNNATAALYRYTPHVFNGNYNFWKFFNSWFRYPNGTLLKLANGVDTYVIQNGLKALVPQFVAQARNLNLNNTIVVSPTEFDTYDTDKPLGPTDNTIVTIIGENTKYVFINNIKHQASDLVIKQRGLDPNKVLSVSAQDAAIYEDGSVLPPKDGTVIRGQTQPQVYLVQNGQIKLYSSYTFGQAKIKAKDIVLVPDTEINTYTKNGFVPPKDGSLIKLANSSTIYLIQNGLRKAVLSEVFKNQGYKIANVGVITSDEYNALPIGAYAQPKDRTFFAVDTKTGPLYEIKDGTAHPISSFVAKQRGITPDIVFQNAVFVEWYTGIPVPPKDGTLIKGDKDGTVYLVKSAQLLSLTDAQFKAGHYKVKNIKTLPQAEVDSYAKVGAVTQ